MRNTQWIILLVLLLNNLTTKAQSATLATPAVDLNRILFFAEQKPVEITLATDFKKMLSERKKGVYQPGTATLHLSPTESVTDNIRLYARGEYRRKECNMPGLMINFKNEDKTGKLSALKKMKLVCGCTTNEYGEQLLLMEYLIYKMYNQLTDMSFQVRLAKINYKDVREKMKPYTQYAFLLEDVDDMAERNKCTEIEEIKFNTEQTNRQQTTIVSLFQYMIGNTDWSVPTYHNVKLIKDSTALPYVVPYDFDFAGAINARYAAPVPELGIQSVTERLYRGFPRNMGEVQMALDVFRKQKDNLLSMVKNFELLNKRERDGMYRYVEEFYKIIEDKKDVQKIFIDNARTQ